jgi:hypothetical protein
MVQYRGAKNPLTFFSQPSHDLLATSSEKKLKILLREQESDTSSELKQTLNEMKFFKFSLLLLWLSNLLTVGNCQESAVEQMKQPH